MARNQLLTATRLLAPSALLSLLACGPAQAATLITSGEEVTGVSGLLVNGQGYAVTFVDGTCAGLFAECNASSDFDFTSLVDAEAASTALEAALAGFPDPDRIAGCDSAVECSIWTPYALGGAGSSSVFAALVLVFNDPLLGGAGTTLGGGSTPVISNFGDTTSLGSSSVWAKWTPTPIPLPATAWLLLGSIAGLAGMARRRQRDAR